MGRLRPGQLEGKGMAMYRSRNGGDRDGLGIYEMSRMALYHRLSFYLILFMLRFHMVWMVKRVLGVH